MKSIHLKHLPLLWANCPTKNWTISSDSQSPTMIAEYKRILIPQQRMQERLNEFCQFFLNDSIDE